MTALVTAWNSESACAGLGNFFCDPLRTLARTSSGFSGRTSGFFSGAFIFHTTLGVWWRERDIYLYSKQKKVISYRHNALASVLGGRDVRILDSQHDGIHEVLSGLNE